MQAIQEATVLGQRLEGQKQILQFLGWTRWEKVARLRAQGDRKSVV